MEEKKKDALASEMREAMKPDGTAPDEKYISINIRAPKNLNPQSVLTGLLVLLIGISALQTYQLTMIRNGSGASVRPVQAQGESSTTPLPESLNNLPDMVGGC